MFTTESSILRAMTTTFLALGKTSSTLLPLGALLSDSTDAIPTRSAQRFRAYDLSSEVKVNCLISPLIKLLAI